MRLVVRMGVNPRPFRLDLRSCDKRKPHSFAERRSLVYVRSLILISRLIHLPGVELVNIALSIGTAIAGVTHWQWRVRAGS